MPRDPVINDHFADCLWMNDNKIQARYYWNYVLSLEDTEEDLKTAKILLENDNSNAFLKFFNLIAARKRVFETCSDEGSILNASFAYS